MSSNRKSAAWAVRIAALLLFVVAAQALHRRFDEPWLAPLQPAAPESSKDLSDVWLKFMSDDPKAGRFAAERLSDQYPVETAAAIEQLLPSKDDLWLTTLIAAESDGPATLRIVSPRGRVVGPHVSIVATGATQKSILWTVSLTDGRVLATATSTDAARVRVPGSMAPDINLVLTATHVDDGNLLARSEFSVASAAARYQWKKDLALLTRVVDRRAPRLYGQIVLAMKGGFFGAAAEISERMATGSGRDYLQRLWFLHRFHGRAQAALGVRELLSEGR